jgi:hypothetical protein
LSAPFVSSFVAGTYPVTLLANGLLGRHASRDSLSLVLP